MDEDSSSLQSQDTDKRKYLIQIICYKLNLLTLLVPDTPTSLTKVPRDSKESTPTTSIVNDSNKQTQQVTERKLLHRDNSHESSDKELPDVDRRVPVVCSKSSFIFFISPFKCFHQFTFIFKVVKKEKGPAPLPPSMPVVSKETTEEKSTIDTKASTENKENHSNQNEVPTQPKITANEPVPTEDESQVKQFDLIRAMKVFF